MWSSRLFDYEYTKRVSFIPEIKLQTLLGLALLILIFKIITNQFRRNPKFVKAASLFRGPPELPLLGNGLDFLLPGSGGIHGLQVKYTEKYGPRYRIWFGNQLWICLSDPEDVQAVYRNSKLESRQRTLIPFYRVFGEGITTTPSIPRWKEERQHVLPTLSRNVVKSFICNLNEIVRVYVRGLQNRADGTELDVKCLFSDLVLDVLAQIQFGCCLQQEEKRKVNVLDNAEKMLKWAGAQVFFPILNTKPLNFIIHKTCLGRIKATFSNLIRKMLIKRLEEDEEKSIEIFSSTFVSRLYRVFQETGEEKLLMDELLTLFVPSTAPVARLLAYTTLIIAMYPEVQEKLYCEILDILGDNDKQPEYSDIFRFTYLDQVFKEILRLNTPGTIGFRELDEDLSIGSLNLPAGTGLMINNAALHLNPKYYSEPYKFNPENFSPDAVTKRPKCAFVPFGGGSRRCIGQEYAANIYKLTLIELVRNFKICTFMKQEDIIIINHLSPFLQDGNYVSLTKRNTEN